MAWISTVPAPWEGPALARPDPPQGNSAGFHPGSPQPRLSLWLHRWRCPRPGRSPRHRCAPGQRCPFAHRGRERIRRYLIKHRGFHASTT